MRSKLFHAVVGVGISLGSATACGGVADSEGLGGPQPDAKAPKPHPTAEAGADTGINPPTPDAGVDTGIVPPTPDAAETDSAVTADAAPDGGVLPDASIVDAAPDAPKDAIVDAFCDATWPITKSGREVCGPTEECKGLPTPWCFTQDAQGSCSMQPLICVDQQWQCLGGATPTNTPSPPFPCQ